MTAAAGSAPARARQRRGGAPRQGFDPLGQIMFCRAASSNATGTALLTIMRPERYNVRESEQKWQKAWADAAVFATRNDDPRPKYYVR